MLFLKFRIGSEGYVLDSAQIAEILPLLEITHVPHAPAGIAGLINYRGRPVPVIDLPASSPWAGPRGGISTRLILVHYGERLLGLIAEQATEMMRREVGSFTDSGLASDAAPYLGPVTQDGGRLIRWIEVQNLLPRRRLSSVLFRQAGEKALVLPQNRSAAEGGGWAWTPSRSVSPPWNVPCANGLPHGASRTCRSTGGAVDRL